MFNTLSHIGQKLNEGKVVWAVGASVLLNHYGLADKPNDIDILVDLNSIEKADKILKGIGEKKTPQKIGIYSTKYFYEYVVNGFDIDVMSGLRIQHSNGVFEYIFDRSSIPEIKEINGVNIPLSSLEDWYVIYQLIPNREKKVEIIKNYLLSKGIKNPNLFERVLTLSLPNNIKENIRIMLNS